MWLAVDRTTGLAVAIKELWASSSELGTHAHLGPHPFITSPIRGFFHGGFQFIVYPLAICDLLTVVQDILQFLGAADRIGVALHFAMQLARAVAFAHLSERRPRRRQVR